MDGMYHLVCGKVGRMCHLVKTDASLIHIDVGKSKREIQVLVL